MSKDTLSLFVVPPPHDPATEEPLDLDDHDDAHLAHLADPPTVLPVVIVEAVGDGFEVSRLRDNGSTVACVMWTRDELEELGLRIKAALRVT